MATRDQHGDERDDPVRRMANEMRDQFAKLDGKLDELAEKQGAPSPDAPPIANFQSRMKSAWQGFQDAAVQYNRMMPGRNLFGPLGALAVTLHRDEQRRTAEAEREFDKAQIRQQREARIARDQSQSSIFESWRPPESSNWPVSGAPPVPVDQASSVVSSAPVLPSPASAGVTTPPSYAGLALPGSAAFGGVGGAAGGSSPAGFGGDAVAVLRELLTEVRNIARRLDADDDGDPSDSVEERRQKPMDVPKTFEVPADAPSRKREEGRGQMPTAASFNRPQQEEKKDGGGLGDLLTKLVGAIL